MPNQTFLQDQNRTDLVSFSLKVDREKVGVLQAPIMAVSIRREINKIPWAKLTLRDGDAPSSDFAISNEDRYVPGREIEILMGYHGEERTVFKGIIIKHGITIRDHAPAVLEIECKDVAVKMTVGRKNGYFSEMTDSDLIEEVLGRYDGISPEVESTPAQHLEVVQYHATDWDFVVSRADANGMLVVVEDGKVAVKKPDLQQSPQVALQYGTTIREFEGEIDARYQYKSVKAKAWDPAAQALLEEEATPPAIEAEQGDLGTAALADALGLDHLSLRHSGKVADHELKSWADAQLQRSYLAKIRGRLRLQGTGEIKPGDLVELQGLGNRFNGPAFVSVVHQHFNGQEWLTELQLGLEPDFFYRGKDVSAPSAHGLLPAVAGLQVGVVTKLEEDPEGEDRIKVKCPIIDDNEEGAWARLASLDAGNDRGWVVRPEIGDEVIVGFLNDDPRDPVVLGQLYSGAKPAPIPGKDDNHIKGYTSRSKMRLEFDDEKKIITIETPGGNHIILNEEDQGIFIKDQNDNTVTLDPNGITMDSPKDIIITAGGKIEIVATQDLTLEGMNVAGKANAMLKMEGQGGAEVSSAANTVVKGSLVQIN